MRFERESEYDEFKRSLRELKAGVQSMDWTQRGFVVVDIYYDSVEILSSGWFIEGQIPERHLAGLDKDSTTRNELIARMLFRSKEIESYGSGMPRIKELCDEAGIRVE